MSTASEPSFLKVVDSFSQVDYLDLPSGFFLERKENKYIFHKSSLEPLLESKLDSMHLVTSQNATHQKYYSVYFDTEEYNFYMAHHNKRRPRLKIRKRYYSNTDQSYIEYKLKTNNQKLVKTRFEGTIPKEEHWKETLLEPYLNQKLLHETVSTEYSRISLVGYACQHKLTLDFDFVFSSQKETSRLDNVVIAEWKYTTETEQDIEKFLYSRNRRLQTSKVSKYCLAMALLDPHVKINSFKPLLKKISTIENRIIT